MRVLLINPPSTTGKPQVKTYATFPNGILYMAAVLEKGGHQVMVHDANVCERKAEEFKSFNPQLIGLSVVTGPNIKAAISCTKEFKKEFPKASVAWGGAHSSTMPEQTIKEEYIDYVVVGAGEYTVLELANKLEQNERDLSGIKGLVHKNNGIITVNEPRPFIEDINTLPDPAWHLVDVKKYWDVTLNTSRGCPFKCTFCYNTAFHKGYRAELTPERIVSQIEKLKSRYGIKYVKIWEDNFTFNVERLRRFCNLLIEKKVKIKWDTESRADLEEEDVALMAKSGCVSVGLGVETGSQRLLSYLKKGVNLKKVEKTFWYFVKHGILARLYILEALPTETVEDFKLTQDLLKRLDHPPYTYMHFVPYPGTTLLQKLVSEGRIKAPEKLAEWADFTSHYAMNVNLSEVPDSVLAEARAEFGAYYAIRHIRFSLKHYPLYFLRQIAKPAELFRTLRNLLRYYLMVFSNTQAAARLKTASFKASG